MGESINKVSERVDLDINTDPYQHNIAPNKDQIFLRVLCDALDVGVSILDQNLDYQFISNSVFRDLEIDKGDLKVGDSLSRCHELMMEKGLLTPELMEENKLSAEEQRSHIENHEEDLPTLMKLGDGSSHKFIRKTLPNGYTVSMSHNVSELVEKDRLLNEALALGRAGYWTYDIPTKKLTLSLGLQKLLPENVITAMNEGGFFAMVHPEDRSVAIEAIKNARKHNDTFRYNARALSRAGKHPWGKTVGDIIRDKDGKPTKIRAFVINIEKEKQQAQELERAKDEAIAASHAKSEFLANMSHEIRTPMNGVLGMAELLANSEINERQREFVNVINNSASALLTIINDILDFSKIEAGAFEMDPMPFDLKASVNDVTSMLSSKAQEKGLELIINYPADMASQFIGDGGRLRQVITNLVGNAIKFTEEGHIIINVAISEPRNNIAFVTLNVTDTGIGIEEEKLNQVFNKFTQADNSTTRVYGGTGLGLSISKAIVELMDGRMTARSELGKGSTFTARIPLEIDRNAISKTFDTSELRGKRALVVDDIKVNRSLLTEQLSSWDISSDSVKDGVEALEALKTEMSKGQPYDFILLDFLMPGMNGQELASLITSNPSLAGTPIIMLSSCDQPVSTQELQSNGINNYLIKPVREKRLYETIVDTFTKESKADDTSARKATDSVQEKPAKTEILVAEDFPLNQDVVRLMLADTSYAPVFANNGLEAVELYKANPARFPVIIMDVSMPVMDGHEATGLIQSFEKEQELSPTPIIALTGHALKNDRDECLNAGMCDYLTKPVKQTELLKKIELWTENAGDEGSRKVA